MSLSNDQPCVAECLDCPWSRPFEDVLAADTAAGEHEAAEGHFTAIDLGDDR